MASGLQAIVGAEVLPYVLGNQRVAPTILQESMPVRFAGDVENVAISADPARSVQAARAERQAQRFGTRDASRCQPARQ
jgi:hypothetical protein